MSDSNSRRYLYLHGFASSRLSRKGVALRERLVGDGVELELLDLNVPSFEKQTYTAILRFLDEIDRSTAAGTKLRIAGSSMGGYLAARWAELHPERVERLFLLCPGFDLPARWPLILGQEQMDRWREAGVVAIEDAAGEKRPLHWKFVEDAQTHTKYPEVRCPTRILHGTRDDVVPIELSRKFLAGRPHVELVEVDDDHPLTGSIERVTDEIRDFFEIAGAAGDVE